jgi:hypothetical protein
LSWNNRVRLNRCKCRIEEQTSSTDAFAGRFHEAAYSESGRSFQSQSTASVDTAPGTP